MRDGTPKQQVDWLGILMLFVVPFGSTAVGQALGAGVWAGFGFWLGIPAVIAWMQWRRHGRVGPIVFGILVLFGLWALAVPMLDWLPLAARRGVLFLTPLVALVSALLYSARIRPESMTTRRRRAYWAVAGVGLVATVAIFLWWRAGLDESVGAADSETASKSPDGGQPQGIESAEATDLATLSRRYLPEGQDYYGGIDFRAVMSSELGMAVGARKYFATFDGFRHLFDSGILDLDRLQTLAVAGSGKDFLFVLETGHDGPRLNMKLQSEARETRLMRGRRFSVMSPPAVFMWADADGTVIGGSETLVTKLLTRLDGAESDGFGANHELLPEVSRSAALWFVVGAQSARDWFAGTSPGPLGDLSKLTGFTVSLDMQKWVVARFSYQLETQDAARDFRKLFESLRNQVEEAKADPESTRLKTYAERLGSTPEAVIRFFTQVHTHTSDRIVSVGFDLHADQVELASKLWAEVRKGAPAVEDTVAASGASQDAIPPEEEGSPAPPPTSPEDSELSRFVAEAEQKCAKGDQRSCYEWASALATGTGTKLDRERASALLATACRNRIGEACQDRAMMVLRGATDEAHYEQGAALLDRGCELRVAGACSLLAALYLEGRGVAADPKRALKLMKKACRLNAGDCLQLGLAYDVGKWGVRRSASKARANYVKACDADQPYACSALGAMFKGTPKGTKYYRKAREVGERVCAEGVYTGCSLAAVAYMEGMDGTERDRAKALSFATEACDFGDPKGCAILGALLSDGSASEQKRAVDAIRRACQLGLAHENCAKFLEEAGP